MTLFQQAVKYCQIVKLMTILHFARAHYLRNHYLHTAPSGRHPPLIRVNRVGGRDNQDCGDSVCSPLERSAALVDLARHGYSRVAQDVR